MARAVGIDLGTTNSVVAVLEGGDPVVVANSEGSRTTPSVVAFARNGEVLVGQPAKNQAVTNVDRTIRSVKRHMGTDWSVEIDGKDYTAQEISARTLQKLKRDAESYLGEDITDACKAAGIVPHEDRAFGPVYLALARQGAIVRVGYMARRRGHGAPAPGWRLA